MGSINFGQFIFMNKLRFFVNLIFVPLAKLVAFFKRPDPIINDNDFTRIRLAIKDGDALFSRTEWELSNIGLPGFYKHAALYIGGYVWQATTGGVGFCSLEEFCYKKDGISIGRLHGPDWTNEQLLAMLLFVSREMGKPYDYSFSWNTLGSWYCSKLVLFAFKEGNAESAEAINTMTVLGEKEIPPQNLFEDLVNVCQVGIIK
jgi:hypothetical protein